MSTLKKMLKKIDAEDAHEKLAVIYVIQDKLDLNCVADIKIGEIMRWIRSQASGLIIRWEMALNIGSKSPLRIAPTWPLSRFGRKGEKYE